MVCYSMKIRLHTSVTLKDGKHPVVLQIIYKNPGDRKSSVRRIRLGLSANKSQWDVDRFKQSSKFGKENNLKLDDIESNSWKVFYNHFQNKNFHFKNDKYTLKIFILGTV